MILSQQNILGLDSCVPLEIFYWILRESVEYRWSLMDLSHVKLEMKKGGGDSDSCSRYQYSIHMIYSIKVIFL